MTKLPSHLESVAALKEAILGRDDPQFVGNPCLVCSGKGSQSTHEGYGGYDKCLYCLGTGIVSDEEFKRYYDEMVKKWREFVGDDIR